jgi:hypothetical protein
MIAEYDISLGRVRVRDAQKGSRARQNNPKLVKFAGLCQPQSIPNVAHGDIVTDGEAKPRALSSRIGREKWDLFSSEAMRVRSDKEGY